MPLWLRCSLPFPGLPAASELSLPWDRMFARFAGARLLPVIVRPVMDTGSSAIVHAFQPGDSRVRSMGRVAAWFLSFYRTASPATGPVAPFFEKMPYLSSPKSDDDVTQAFSG